MHLTMHPRLSLPGSPCIAELIPGGDRSVHGNSRWLWPEQHHGVLIAATCILNMLGIACTV